MGKVTADDFANRDERGLVKTPTRPADEAAERVFYFKLYATWMTSVGPALAWLLYWALGQLAPAARARCDAKLELVREHELGWVYATWLVVFFARTYLAINANGARAAARLDRPDQHVYKIMANPAEGSDRSRQLADAPYVLMENTGAAGRFNRAQRAAANMDEGLAGLLAGLLLTAFVFGPIALVLALANGYGRFRYANLYKLDKEQRLAGFVPAQLAEQVVAGLVGLVAIKTLVSGSGASQVATSAFVALAAAVVSQLF